MSLCAKIKHNRYFVQCKFMFEDPDSYWEISNLDQQKHAGMWINSIICISIALVI